MSKATAEPVIMVISRDADFAEPLMQQVIGELAMPCAIVDTTAGAKPWKSSLALVVTNEELAEECPVPVLKLSAPPFRMQVILEDIKSLLQKQSQADLRLGSHYTLRAREKELVYTVSKQSASLTDKEVKLLQCLFGGDVVSKEQLLKNVWDMGAVLDTHTLETHIYRLRAKFRELGDEDAIVAEGGGYTLRVD